MGRASQTNRWYLQRMCAVCIDSKCGCQPSIGAKSGAVVEPTAQTTLNRALLNPYTYVYIYKYMFGDLDGKRLPCLALPL